MGADGRYVHLVTKVHTERQTVCLSGENELVRIQEMNTGFGLHFLPLHFLPGAE